MDRRRTTTQCIAGLAAGVFFVTVIGCSGPTRPPEAQSPIVARLWIDQVETYPGTVGELCVRLSSDGNPAIAAEEIGGLDFLLYYDMAALTFQSIKRDSVLSGWEYWTYRLMEPGKPMGDSIALIRIQAHRDLDNGVDSPAPSGLSDGPLFRVGFLATSNWEFLGTDSPVGFWRDGCNDNTVWMADDPTNLLIANMDYSPGEDYLAFDTLACARRMSLSPALGFRSGSVRFTEPPDDRPLAGDLNLDGQHFTISDVVLFSNYLVTWEFPWVKEDSLRQLEAADCNQDGEPFSIADFEFLMQVVTGAIPSWSQISEPNVDTLYIWEERLANEPAYSLTASNAVSLILLDVEVNTDSRPTITFPDPAPHFTTHYRGNEIRVIVGKQLPDTVMSEGQRLNFQIGIEWGGVHSLRAQASTYPGVPMAVVGPNPRR